MNTVKQFFADKHFEIEKLVDRKPSNVSDKDVIAAAAVLYKRIKDGLQIRDIEIPRTVWKIANTSAVHKRVKKLEDLTDLGQTYKQKFWSRLTFWISFTILLMTLEAAAFLTVMEKIYECF